MRLGYNWLVFYGFRHPWEVYRMILDCFLDPIHKCAENKSEFVDIHGDFSEVGIDFGIKLD